MTQPPQQPPEWSSEPPGWLYTPGATGPVLGMAGRPVCCSWKGKRDLEFEKNPEEQNGTDLIVFTDFANQVTESLVHIDTLLSRRLDKSTPQVFGEVATLYYRNGQQTS